MSGPYFSAFDAPQGLLDAIANPDAHTSDYELLAAGANLTERVETFTVTHQASGAIVLDATISDRLDPFLYANAPVRLNCWIGDYEVRLMDGWASNPSPKRTYTRLVAYSPLGLMERSKFNQPISYRGDVAKLLKERILATSMYPQGQVRANVGGRRVRFVDEDAFGKEQSVRDLLSRVSAETGCVYRDTNVPSCECFLPPEGTEGRVAFEYEAVDGVGSERPGVFDFEAAPEVEGMYDSVRVYREGQPEADPPVLGFDSGFVGVPYRNLRYRPNSSFVDNVIVSDDDPVNGLKNAKRMARERAAMHARMTHKLKLVVPFNPLFRMWDTVAVHESFGEERYLWRGPVSGEIKHTDLRETGVLGRCWAA